MSNLFSSPSPEEHQSPPSGGLRSAFIRTVEYGILLALAKFVLGISPIEALRAIKSSLDASGQSVGWIDPGPLVKRATRP